MRRASSCSTTWTGSSAWRSRCVGLSRRLVAGAPLYKDLSADSRISRKTSTARRLVPDRAPRAYVPLARAGGARCTPNRPRRDCARHDDAAPPAAEHAPARRDGAAAGVGQGRPEGRASRIPLWLHLAHAVHGRLSGACALADCQRARRGKDGDVGPRSAPAQLRVDRRHDRGLSPRGPTRPRRPRRATSCHPLPRLPLLRCRLGHAPHPHRRGLCRSAARLRPALAARRQAAEERRCLG